MPRVGEKTRPYEGNGHEQAAPSRFAQYLAAQLRGTDEIVIGSNLPVPGENGTQVRAGNMAAVMKIVAGIRYLVRGWIPYGMLTMLLGPPGFGKSAFALFALVRVIVLGASRWFCGMSGPSKPGYVLWCDTEGAAAITVQRIKDWGLPANRIKVPFEDDPLRPVNLTNDAHLEQIEAIINKYRTKLVVIDSLRGAHDGEENNSRIAQVLQKLAGIAERTKAAIIIVHHTKKLMVDEELTANSSRGSGAIVAMVRSQLGIDKPNKNSDWFRVQMLKENLGLRPKAIGFRVTSQGLEFGDAPAKPRRQTEKDRAEQFLRDTMKPGQWHNAAELIEDAGQQGISEDTLHRAKTSLGIEKPKFLKKEKEGWKWMLPGGK